MIQYLPMIASLAGSAYGAIQEGQERKRMAAERQKWNAENEALFNQDYYSDYTKRADSQNVIRQMRNQQQNENKVDQNVAAVTGASPDAMNARKERRNKAMTDLYSNLGAVGAQWKDSVKGRYQARKQALQGLEYDTMNQRAQSANNLMYNGIKTLGSTDWSGLVGGYKKPELK